MCEGLKCDPCFKIKGKTVDSNMKKTKEILLTEQEWLGIQSIASNFDLSIPEFFNSLISHKLLVVNPDLIEDKLDLQEALKTLAEAEQKGEIPMLWEDFQQEIE